MQRNFVVLKTVNDYHSTTIFFGAVVSDTSREFVPFWIGMVVNWICHSIGKIINLTKGWYKMQEKCNAAHGELCPSYLNGKGEVKWRPWVVVIALDGFLRLLSASSGKRKNIFHQPFTKRSSSSVYVNYFKTENSFTCYKDSKAGAPVSND